MAQTYAMPVFKYTGVYLGLPTIYYVKSLGNRMGTELAWSPDSKVWLRIDEGSRVIPLGEKRARDYDWGCIFAANDPVILKDEIRIYYSGQAFPHGMNPGYFCLATLRPDGWAGFEPKDKNKPAVLLTNPVVCSAETLRISADGKGGSIETTVLDEKGKTLALGKPMTDDVTDAPVEFGNGELKNILRRWVRLQFKLNRAKIYAFGFKN
jgi:hypothetical protein